MGGLGSRPAARGRSQNRRFGAFAFDADDRSGDSSRPIAGIAAPVFWSAAADIGRGNAVFVGSAPGTRVGRGPRDVAALLDRRHDHAGSGFAVIVLGRHVAGFDGEESKSSGERRRGADSDFAAGGLGIWYPGFAFQI